MCQKNVHSTSLTFEIHTIEILSVRAIYKVTPWREFSTKRLQATFSRRSIKLKRRPIASKAKAKIKLPLPKNAPLPRASKIAKNRRPPRIRVFTRPDTLSTSRFRCRQFQASSRTNLSLYRKAVTIFNNWYLLNAYECIFL